MKARIKRIVPRFNVNECPISSDSDHRASPIAIKSVFLKVQPTAATTKTTNAMICRSVLKLMGRIVG